nr:MAG TPA: hypothetical protein [Caudoviricetes sp.]
MDTKKEGDQPSLSAFKGITLESHSTGVIISF